MAKKITERDIKDGKDIAALFENISEESKIMIIGYLSALKDKEIADSGKKLQEV